MSELLTTAEAAKVLGYAVQTMRIFRMKGTGPKFVRLTGRRSRAFYRREDLEAFIEARIYKSTSDESARAAAEGEAK